ncbi:MAG: hypothetical protein K2Y05_07210 [Hyphomicrobiaceae bacterium]|nr:hypothetical protein [Hyphomicrobiaceae bacterium]
MAGEADVDLMRFANVPGTTVTRSVEGNTTITTLTRGGVLVTQENAGGKVAITGKDHSGYGAIMCLWMTMVTVKATLASCFPGQYDALRRHVDATIDELNDFIVANSLTPVTKAEMVAKTTALFEQTRVAPGNPSCRQSPFAMMIAQMARQVEASSGGPVKLLDLGPPRPPVWNPCF